MCCGDRDGSGHYSATKHTGIAIAEIYWHFVDIIWIVLFTLLYVLTQS
ncbi:cytochrome c oxidase subunit 3 [Gloeocapsopsis crepidinum]